MGLSRSSHVPTFKNIILKTTILAFAFTLGYNFNMQFDGEAIVEYLQKFVRPNAILNITHFHFDVNPEHKCRMGFLDVPRNRTIITVVHSARANFLQRQIVRKTFGSVKEHKGWFVQTVFALGQPAPSEHNSTQIQLDKEVRNYQDIVVGNFIDSYRNLSYKHLMGMKFALENCQAPSFYIKADDDIVVDLFHIIDFLSGNQSTTLGRNFYCYRNGSPPVRDVDDKWYVTRQEYAPDSFPRYCSMAVYVTKIKTVKKIFSVANLQDFLWIDDVYVTGLLRERANKGESDPSRMINFVGATSKAMKDISNTVESFVRQGLLGILQSSTPTNTSCSVWKTILEVYKLDKEFVSTCQSLFSS